MIRRCCHHWFLIAALTAGADLSAIAPASAQTAAAPTPLELLSQQTQALYHQVSRGVVRVQLPIRSSASPSGLVDPLAPWTDKLNPDIRNRLEQGRGSGTVYVAEILHSPQTTLAAPRQIILFSANVVGVVVDADGHAVLPRYVAQSDVGNSMLPVMLDDGTLTHARFIGSDEKTNVTIVQVPRGAVRPLLFSSTPPQEGSLVMVIPLDPSATHLGMWTRWSTDWGLVFRADGAVAGFAERGRFLTGALLSPTVREIILHGSVHRPRLGVWIHEVGPSDPQRLLFPALADIPAIRITQVLPNTPASRAALQVGDLILTLGGQPVGDPQSFAAVIEAADRGPTKLQVLRQDEIISVTVDLEADLPG